MRRYPHPAIAFTVTLHSANGIVYQILFCDSLSYGSWSLLADQVIGNGGDLSIVDFSASYFNQRFYRAKVVW